MKNNISIEFAEVNSSDKKDRYAIKKKKTTYKSKVN